MFTGIVQKVASVLEIKPVHIDGAESILLRISNAYASESSSDPIALGESIANNGVCLTVTKFDNQSLQFDLSPATLSATALGRLKVGSKLNLERSLRMGDRLSGHWVQGHVDGTAKVAAINEINEGFYDLEIEPTDASLLRYCVKKGSLCVDGISLTIQDISAKKLSFQIIPHTFSETALRDLRIGDLVNIEVDLLAKYIERFRQYDDSRS